jgi:hypothetical protein
LAAAPLPLSFGDEGDALDLVVENLKSTLTPLLRGDGFRGRFPRFRRQRGELIHEVAVQGWRHGGQRTINLSFGFAFLAGLKQSHGDGIEYSYRIGTADGNDRWWKYDPTSASDAEAVTRDMLAVYQRESGPFFERFKEFPASFLHYEPDDFVDAPLSFLPPRIGVGRSIARDCWVFMHVWRHLGNLDVAKRYAMAGLVHVGRAASLGADFQDFLGGSG